MKAKRKINMLKEISLVGALSVVLSLICTPSVAQMTHTTNSLKRGATYLVPAPKHGAPIVRPSACGNVTKTADALYRDLGKGLGLGVLPSFTEGGPITVNLIFSYYEEKDAIKLTPEKFELHFRPSGNVSTPSKILRRSIEIEEQNQFQEEVYLEFKSPSEVVDSLEFVFPLNTISTTQGDSSPLIVRPFAFSLKRDAEASLAPIKNSPCMYSPINWSRLLH